MYRYVIKRLLFLIPTILGVILIIFVVMNLTPSTPGRIMLGPSATEADVEQLNHELGYDQPIMKRYVDYVVDVFAHQDFGTSYYTKQPVFDEIWPRYITTIKLALIGIDHDTGEVITGYYNCLMSDKAVMAANIQADAILDSVMANADSIVQKAEEIAENEGLDET